MQLIPRRTRDERGTVVVLVAILAVFLFGLAALVVDLGYGRVEQRAAQNTADAAALAGGNALFGQAQPYLPDVAVAEAAAKAYAARNIGVTEAEWSSCTDPGRLPSVATSQCISFDITPTTARVRVLIPTRVVGTTFAKIIGIDDMSISAAARSTLNRDGKSLCGLCVVGADTLHDVQNGEVQVSGADIHLNGNVSVNGNGLVATDGAIRVEGTASGNMSDYDPNPETGAPRIPDPLEDWYEKPDMTGLLPKSDPCTHGPGKYGAENFPNGPCNLSPGLYVVTGKWDLTGNAGLAGAGVTLYFTCGTPTNVQPCTSPGQAGGWLNFAGNGVFDLSAPTTGPYAGMAIWYDRLNTSPLDLTGNGTFTYTGTTYAKSASLRFTGNACATGGMGALVIVQTIELNGTNPCLKIDYDQGQNVQLPPGRLHLDE